MNDTILELAFVMQVQKNVHSLMYYFHVQKSIDAPFNSIEDCGVDIKFVNGVYDALLNTVSKMIQ